MRREARLAPSGGRRANVLLISRETVSYLPPAAPHVFHDLPGTNPDEYLNAIKGGVHGRIPPQDRNDLVRTVFCQMQILR
jgi:hypothetical protein